MYVLRLACILHLNVGIPLPRDRYRVSTCWLTFSENVRNCHRDWEGRKTRRVSIHERCEVLDWLAALLSTLGRYTGPWRGVRMDIP